MNPIKVLWFIEHKARELDVACAVKCLAESRHPVQVLIKNIYLHAAEVLDGPAPDLVVYPFFYQSAGALGTEHYVRAWPAALHLNLAWEELFYSANARIKGPSDDFARNRVLHHAWGEFYRSFLVDHGVPAGNVFVNGNPAYQLYKSPYSKIAPSRAELARRHELDAEASWIFIPENYRWAFTTDNKLQRIAASEDHLQELLRMKEHCIASLEILMRWCNEAARSARTEILLRPRPATNTRHMLEFLEKRVGKAEPRFRILKDGSVREWILASDVVMSSFSTSLIEAAIARKPIYMIEPLPLPEGLHSPWYVHVARLSERDEFLRAATPGQSGGSPEALRGWAESELLAHGDPISNLADLLGRLADPEQRLAPLPPRGNFLTRWRERFDARRAREEGKRSIAMNRDTHEGDDLDDAELADRAAQWARVLGVQRPEQDESPRLTPPPQQSLCASWAGNPRGAQPRT